MAADDKQQNTTQQPVATPKPTPPATPQPPSAGQGPATPKEPDLKELFKFFDGRLGLILGLVFTVAVIVALLVIGGVVKRPKLQKPPEASAPVVDFEIATPNPEMSPEKLPPVKEESKTKVIRDYFLRVSPTNFEEKFMAQVPEAAVDSYIKYTQVQSPDQKQEAAQGFYVALDNPGVDRSDPKFTPFILDIRRDLEKTLGKPLF